ncbi:DUF6515 family protein [Flavitalea sp.]|nr:DUF6515 family protein [Flavitalea sp.]
MKIRKFQPKASLLIGLVLTASIHFADAQDMNHHTSQRSFDNSGRNNHASNGRNFNLPGRNGPISPGFIRRPPNTWQGKRYYSFRPYFYHPYRPYSWGPLWRPWGFFSPRIPASAIVINFQNRNYRYDQGIWYNPTNGGYTVVQAPIGALISFLPAGTQTLFNNNVPIYYYGGTYYQQSGPGYVVIAPPAGTIVQNLPPGGQEVTIGGQVYVNVNGVFYQPVENNQYEVAQVDSNI